MKTSRLGPPILSSCRCCGAKLVVGGVSGLELCDGDGSEIMMVVGNTSVYVEADKIAFTCPALEFLGQHLQMKPVYRGSKAPES